MQHVCRLHSHHVFLILQHILNSVFLWSKVTFFSRMNWKWRDKTCLGPVSIAREPHGYRPMTTEPQGLGSIPRHCLFRTLWASRVSLPDNTHSRSPSLFIARSHRQLMETEVSVSDRVLWLWCKVKRKGRKLVQIQRHT